MNGRGLPSDCNAMVALPPKVGNVTATRYSNSHLFQNGVLLTQALSADLFCHLRSPLIMLDKHENYLSIDCQAGCDAYVGTVNSASNNAQQGSPIPVDPRVKCIQWSASELKDKRSLKVLSMTGDFSALGIVSSQPPADPVFPSARQQQVFEMLRETQLQEIRDQFETAIRSGQRPEKLELKLHFGDDVFWVEQETLIHSSPAAEPANF